MTLISSIFLTKVRSSNYIVWDSLKRQKHETYFIVTETCSFYVKCKSPNYCTKLPSFIQLHIQYVSCYLSNGKKEIKRGGFNIKISTGNIWHIMYGLKHVQWDYSLNLLHFFVTNFNVDHSSHIFVGIKPFAQIVKFFLVVIASVL